MIALSGPGPASPPAASAGHRSIRMAAIVDRQETVSSSRPVAEHVQAAPSGDVAEKIPPQKANFLSRLFKAGEGRDAEPSEAKGRDSRASEGSWKLPPVSLLRICPPEMQQNGPTPEMLHANARLLETVLSDFGVQGRIVDMHPGPVVTLYELEPAPGIRAARVIGLADDVARSLSVLSVRIATVPGRNVMGIEVPNDVRRPSIFRNCSCVPNGRVPKVFSNWHWARTLPAHPSSVIWQKCRIFWSRAQPDQVNLLA